MSLSNTFREAVKKGDVLGVRIMMKNSLLLDLSFTEFAEMENAARSMKGLYDVHDGQELIFDKTQWSSEYMDLLMVKVVNNFSHERIAHLKDVIRYLKPYNGKNIKHSVRPSNPSHKKIALGSAAGAVVGGVIASAAEVTLLGGIIVGAIGGAVCGAVIGRGDE